MCHTILSKCAKDTHYLSLSQDSTHCLVTSETPQIYWYQDGVNDVQCSYWPHSGGRSGEEQLWSIGGMWLALWPLLAPDPMLGLSSEPPVEASIHLMRRMEELEVKFLPFYLPLSTCSPLCEPLHITVKGSVWNGSVTTEQLCRCVNINNNNAVLFLWILWDWRGPQQAAELIVLICRLWKSNPLFNFLHKYFRTSFKALNQTKTTLRWIMSSWQ